MPASTFMLLVLCNNSNTKVGAPETSKLSLIRHHGIKYVYLYLSLLLMYPILSSYHASPSPLVSYASCVVECIYI